MKPGSTFPPDYCATGIIGQAEPGLVCKQHIPPFIQGPIELDTHTAGRLAQRLPALSLRYTVCLETRTPEAVASSEDSCLAGIVRLRLAVKVGEIFQEKLEEMEMTYPTRNKTAKNNEKNSLRRRGSKPSLWFYVPSPLTIELRRSPIHSTGSNTSPPVSFPLWLDSKLDILRVFENKVLRKIFGTKRDEVTGEWRKLHTTELHALYSSPDIIRNIKSRRLRWAGYVVRMGKSRNAYRVLVGRLEGIRPLGRSRCRWEDNIKTDLREVEYDGRDWINLAQDRNRWRTYVRAAMNLRVLKSHNDNIYFSQDVRTQLFGEEKNSPVPDSATSLEQYFSGIYVRFDCELLVALLSNGTRKHPSVWCIVLRATQPCNSIGSQTGVTLLDSHGLEVLPGNLRIFKEFLLKQHLFL
ncbi:hypothetical protein ANN_21222 [Periplaneta americana]|uniref:Uncharacterized protein n=1 Tax=Periplaneta americana TaxID=6978 RepID=A0ABQ8SER5_PERAM|nr:hypothetical protein ANN_21222 [Periplaneta americana]